MTKVDKIKSRLELYSMKLDPDILSEYNKTRKTKNTDIFCHTPFTTLNFEQNGNATVCCYNREEILGVYPDDSIENMWFGEKANELRNCISNKNLPPGCYLCYDQFQSKNFAGLKAKICDEYANDKYPEEKERFIAMPKVMEFEISNVCNLECIMCTGYYSSSIRKNRENLSPLKSPYDEQFVKQLESFIPHLTEAKFLGGEPFLINIYFEIWDRIIQLNPNMKVSITTNGTILTNRIKDLLEKLNAHIVISIDSLEKDNFESIRVNAKFEQVMENLQYYRDYVARKNTGINMAVCPIHQNWKEIPDLLKFCNEQNINLYFNTVIQPAEKSLKMLSFEKLSEIIRYLKNVEISSATELHEYNNALYVDFIQQLRSDIEHAYHEDGFINNDAFNMYKSMLSIYNKKYKLDESEHLNKQINSIISDILKRNVNQEIMAKMENPENPYLTHITSHNFYTRPLLFSEIKHIRERLNSILEKNGINVFVKEYFNIMKIVSFMLNDNNGESKTDSLSNKLKSISESILLNDKKDFIVQDFIKGDILNIVSKLEEYSLENIKQIMFYLYGA